jgi:hypothetical protein
MPFDLIVGRNESDKKDFGTRGLAFMFVNFLVAVKREGCKTIDQRNSFGV